MHMDDIVVVTGTNSIPSEFLGCYGRVVKLGEYNVTVELKAGIKTFGNLSHTVSEVDLRVVGRLMKSEDEVKKLQEDVVYWKSENSRHITQMQECCQKLQEANERIEKLEKSLSNHTK